MAVASDGRRTGIGIERRRQKWRINAHSMHGHEFFRQPEQAVCDVVRGGDQRIQESIPFRTRRMVSRASRTTSLSST
jgi:hypothetical protein